MAFLVVLGLLGLIVGIVLLILSFIKRNKKTKSLLVILCSFILTIVAAVNMPASGNSESKNTAKVSSESSQSSESESNTVEQEDRSKFYNIDKIVKNSPIGNETMTQQDYEEFAVNAFTLEGAIQKFGLPSHVTGAGEGDETIEVTYPTNEDGYSAGLIFKYEPSGFGDWKLHEKYVVETDGIGFSEYTRP